MNDSRVKIISDIETDSNVVSVKKPFRLITENKRRYIRLEVSEPVTFTVVKDTTGGFWPDGDGPAFEGSILNLSAGGVLIVADNGLDEGTIVLLKMDLQDIEVLDHVVAMVKRSDSTDDEYLLGIEFIPREYLNDVFSRAEIDMLANRVASFDEQIRKTLNKYVYYQRVSQESK